MKEKIKEREYIYYKENNRKIANRICTSKAITLISLVITIIILIILAGVSINISLWENGIFRRASQAKEQYAETAAREKLELALLDLLSQKHTNAEYNEKEYIDNYLTKESMIVTGDVVLVDGWKFIIDRSVPKIGESLGQGEESKKIILTANAENAKDYTKATIIGEIEFEGTITEIRINGQQEQIPEKQEGKYIISKEVETNGKYVVYVKDENDEYKTVTVDVTEISEDMQIRTAQDLVYFRDRVNKGATYEGRTITVVNNIDLSKVCYKVDGTVENDVSFEPIANYQEEGEESTHIFKGTFNGNYHKIENLYINSDKNYRGLFGYVQNGTITGVIIEGIKNKESTEEDAKITSIKGKQRVGAIAGIITDNTQIIRCINKGCIEALANFSGGIIGYNNSSKIEESYNMADVSSSGACIGGISGQNTYGGIIKNCYSIGKVSSSGKNVNGQSMTGGIVGANAYNATVENVYHIGDITAKYTYVGGIVGYNGNSSSGKQIVKNVFNIGTVKYGTKTASSNIGSGIGTLIGRYGSLSGKYGNIEEDEIKGWNEETIKLNIGDSFTKDINNINAGYPILKWQVQGNVEIF